VSEWEWVSESEWVRVCVCVCVVFFFFCVYCTFEFVDRFFFPMFLRFLTCSCLFPCNKERGILVFCVEVLNVLLVKHCMSSSSSSSLLSLSSLVWQPCVGPGLPQKLLPAEVSSYCFFRFHNKSLFQGGLVSPTHKPWLSWRADVFCQGCLP
jgi:hypothetical protein